MKLSRTFPNETGESGLGYYRRLTAANKLTSWKELAKACELSSAQGALLQRPDHVADNLGLQREWAKVASAAYELTVGWRGLKRKGDAVCPHCIRAQPYIRTAWEHVYMVACPEHRVMLTDHCDACGVRLTSDRERIEYCSCGHDLRRMQPQVAPTAFLWLASLISGSASGNDDSGPRISEVNVDVLSLLVRTLCVLANPEFTSARQNAPAPRTVHEAESFLAPLHQLLAEWPKGFEAHVETRLICASPEARTLSAALGKWYGALKSCCAEGPLSCFMEAVGRVAVRKFDGLIGLDGAALPMAAAATHMFASAAAKKIGVHRETLVSHAKKGSVAHRTKKFGTRGLAYEIPIEEVEAITKGRKKWVSFRAAGELLGTSDALVTRMVDSGLIVSDPHWRRDVRKAGPVSQESVTELTSRIKTHRPRKNQLEDGERRIALRELCGRRVGDQQALGSALAAIAAGDIRPLARAEKVGDFVYSMLDIARHFSTPLLEAGLSIQALSKLTGWKWESINYWIGTGFLKSTPVTLRGQAARVVMPSHLVEFSTRYIPLADVASQLGSKSSALAEKLEGLEILGAVPLPNGQRRGGLLRIADLATKAVAHNKLSSASKTAA